LYARILERTSLGAKGELGV